MTHQFTYALNEAAVYPYRARRAIIRHALPVSATSVLGTWAALLAWLKAEVEPALILGRYAAKPSLMRSVQIAGKISVRIVTRRACVLLFRRFFLPSCLALFLTPFIAHYRRVVEQGNERYLAAKGLKP